MSSKHRELQYKNLLEIACDAASIYSMTGADTPEEAILKLSIFGYIDKAK